MLLKNYYRIMRISRNDSQRAVKWAYEGLCRRYYPKDLADGQAKTEEQLENEKRMLEINEAYAVLSDSEKRRNYDERFFGPADSEWQGWAAGGQSARGSLQPDSTGASQYGERTVYFAQIFALGKIMALPLRTKLLFSVPVVALVAGILLGLNWASAPAGENHAGPPEVPAPPAKDVAQEPRTLISTT